MSTVADPPENEGLRIFARVLMWLTTLLVVAGVIVGIVMGSSSDCSSGECEHPHAGSGAGLAIVSMLLGVVAVMGNLILSAVLDSRHPD